MGYIAKERMWLNGDRSRIVSDGDPEAQFLLASGPGDEIPFEEAKRLGLVGETVEINTATGKMAGDVPVGGPFPMRGVDGMGANPAPSVHDPSGAPEGPQGPEDVVIDNPNAQDGGDVEDKAVRGPRAAKRD